MWKSALKVLYFFFFFFTVYCIFRMYIFLHNTVGILSTAREEYHCIIENMFLYCAYDNKHFESLNLCRTTHNLLDSSKLKCYQTHISTCMYSPVLLTMTSSSTSILHECKLTYKTIAFKLDPTDIYTVSASHLYRCHCRNPHILLTRNFCVVDSLHK